MKGKTSSRVDGIEFPFPLSDNKTYSRRQNKNVFRLLKFWSNVFFGYRKADLKLAATLRKKECYYGPFKGEFGHFLAHTLPFLMYLHHKGVKIIYCGMSLHEPFMRDEKGNNIIHRFLPLRDFFHEVSPSSNSTVPPADVQVEITKFTEEALKSGLPFWNIGDNFYYWFVHRSWLMKGHTYAYNIGKAYSAQKENACAIFPRNKGAKSSRNNGEAWDYAKVIELIAPFFDKIYICGHPSQVQNLKTDHPKVELAVGTNNALMLEKTSKAKLIITQHSGIAYVGEYTGTDVMLIYKGGQSPSDIGSLNNTLTFKKQFAGRSKFYYAFSEDQIVSNLTLLAVKQNNNKI